MRSGVNPLHCSTYLEGVEAPSSRSLASVLPLLYEDNGERSSAVGEACTVNTTLLPSAFEGYDAQGPPNATYCPQAANEHSRQMSLHRLRPARDSTKRGIEAPRPTMSGQAKQSLSSNL